MAEKSKESASGKNPREPEEEREDAAEEDGDEPSEEEESDEDDSDEDDSESDAGSEADAGARAKPGKRDETTRGVARALGVDSDEEEDADASDGEDEKKQADAKPNRAQRRRDEAEKRRAAREGKSPRAIVKKSADAKDTEEPDEEEAPKQLPRDKNARAKELLRRRQESAMGKRVSKLEASEVVQDRIVRASSAVGGFLRNNFKAVAAVLVLGLGGAIGVTVYFSHRASVIAKRSDELQKGVAALRGVVAPKGDPMYDAKTALVPMFTSLELRADAAIAEFAKVATAHKGTSAATLARLGEGTAQLDKRGWDAALAAFNEVISSPLASADADLKGRALEGAGYAKEGLEKYDEAIEFFKQVETTKGMEDLGKYHRARMLLKQGNVEEAKTAFIELQKKLEVPLPDQPNSKLLSAGVDSALRIIDPTLVKKKAPTLGGMRGNTMTPEQLRQIQESLKKLENGGHGDEEGPAPQP